MTERDSTDLLRVLDLKPRRDQANKPSELIQITGHQTLSLTARRAITVLWHNAHRQGVEPGKRYTIEIDSLKTSAHNGYELVEEAVIALMQTILTVTRADGSTDRVQFLGGNNMASPDRPAGVFTYSFDSLLVDILKDSTIWGKISLPVLMALSSKYAVSLYEHISQFIGLEHKIHQRVTLEEFRDMLGMEDGKYPEFGALNKHIIKKVIQEINALAPFNVTILPVKTARKVTHIHVGWFMKEPDENRKAMQEIARPKVGRRARIQGQQELVFKPSPGIDKLSRS